jgi:hypothetical protein
MFELMSRDIGFVLAKEAEYGRSWMRRGGIGAFMMAARKWDRLEHAVAMNGYDIFAAIGKDQRPDGIMDDIRDLRNYLLLIEEEMVQQGILDDPTDPDVTTRVGPPTPRTEQQHPFGFDPEVDVA